MEITSQTQKTRPQTWINIALFIIVIALSVVLYFSHKITNDKIVQNDTSTEAKISTLSTLLASTTAMLQDNITKTHNSLSNELGQEKQKSTELQNKLGGFETTVGTISGAVNTLEKLSKTDPELLQKYSKVFFLNEHYAPARLTEVPEQYAYSDKRANKVLSDIWPYLQNMMATATTEQISLYVFSAYRSFDEQQALKNQYTVVYGSGTANQFSADQGYSEHQLGTTIDLITTGIGGTLNGFDNTKAYEWLSQNAYKYGFTLSYPKNNEYYEYEPWHWRFVGVSLATYLHNNGKHFYDLDQREIDEYLVSLFD